MSDMLARLHQSHFGRVRRDVYKEVDDKPGGGEGRTGSEGGVANDQAPDKAAHGAGRAGINVCVVNGEALVTSLDGDSPAAKAGVRPGWRILRIDERDIGLAIEGISKSYRDSTLRDLMLTRSLAFKLNGNLGDTVLMRFLDDTGKTVDLKIGDAPPRGAKTTFGRLPTPYGWGETRMVEGNLGRTTPESVRV